MRASISKFHINHLGDVSKCSARKGKCPFGDENHYSSKEEALLAYEATQNVFVTEGGLSSAAKAALDSPLLWKEHKPRWFHNYEETHRLFPDSHVSLLAKIPSKLGDLAAVCESDSMASNDEWAQKDRGYQLQRIVLKHMKTGLAYGYIKVSAVTEDTLKRSFGDNHWSVFAWAQSSTGHNFNLDKEKAEAMVTLSGEDLQKAKRELWAESYKTRGFPESVNYERRTSLQRTVNLKPEDAPGDTSILDKEIEIVRESLLEDQKNFLEINRVPWVDYIKVEDELRGSGVGAALYVLAARKLAEKGLYLRASGVQTDEAKKAWLRMKDLGLPIRTIENSVGYLSPNKQRTHETFVLDFSKTEVK